MLGWESLLSPEQKARIEETRKKIETAKFWVKYGPYIAIAVVIFLILFALLGGGFQGSGSNNRFIYEYECNYEATQVTVMDGNNTEVLDTVSLEDYVLGVLCPEIGACNGNVANLQEHYIKTKIIATKTYVLARGNYNNTDKSITIRASTRDQQWCSLEDGCIVVKTNDLVPGYSSSYFYDTYPGDYSVAKLDGTVTQKYHYTDEDLKLLRKYYTDTYGELYLSTNYNDKITSLNSGDATQYKSDTQNYWNNQAKNGRTYSDILASTATSGVSNASDYSGKTIYRLNTYCPAQFMGSSGLEQAVGDAEFLNGGMPIPIYYQQDYADVVLKKDKTVSSSGCGFTSSAMIVSYLIGKKITPREFVDTWSRKYYVYNRGMSWGLPSAAASHYGIPGGVYTTADPNEMYQKLIEGHPVMSSQNSGIFTKGGHLIVLRGAIGGKILVNDPNKNNAINKGYNNRQFTLREIDQDNTIYFIWPRKEDMH